jgi:benzoyl-CoA reductase/2-hydroxyglutaryl-CoA dehydratase subunit BcrC/BadD/HgdB
MMDILEWLHDEVRINERRIRRVEEKPDPLKLRANKIYYECQREWRLHDIAAWKEGRPFTLYPGVGLSDLFRSMGINLFDHGQVAMKSTVSNPELMGKVRQAILANGYSEEQCDLATYPVGFALLGMCPPLSFLVRSHSTCQAFGDSNEAIAKLYGVPIYNLDVPLDASEESVAYVTDQLRDLVRWIEKKVPGSHYSDESLEEWLDAEKRWATYLHRVWEAKKHKPCPMTARDGFREESPVYFYPAETREKVVDYARVWAEEMEERVVTGKNLPEERIRLTWTVSAPLYDQDLFHLLESRGVTIPAYLAGDTPNAFIIAKEYDLFGDYSDSGRRLTPLEKVARFHCGCVWNGLADKWLDAISVATREQDTDGIVYFLSRGCPQVSGIMGLAASSFRQKLGKPCLLIKGSMFDMSGYDQAEFLSRVNEFIELILAQKAADG